MPMSESDAGSSTSNSTTAEEELERDVEKWIKQASFIPDNGYDWRPLCRALIENHRDAKGVFQPPPPPPPPVRLPAVPDPGDPSGRARDVFHGIQPQEEPDDLGLVPAKDEFWNHVRYIPHWTDPDYNEDLLQTPFGRTRQNTPRETIYNLRPALRLSDAIRNPTDYALRFGMAEGRLDGRSRMSPTWSKTRNPFDDFANQVNQLSDEDRRLAEDLSRARYRELNRAPVPGQEILPEVMEQLLSKNGLMSKAELVDELKRGINTGMSLDQMVDSLEKQNPQIKEAHKVFFDNALDDQDYQRMIFSGMTTDEMIQRNIYTMSNDVVMDLDNDIFHLFDRTYWDNNTWKGYKAQFPKNVYDVNGTREEWDAANNDTLWEAMQPALRLASMVLSKSPPLLEALMNMNTRQPLPAKQDIRKYKATPCLTQYVLEEDIDMSKTYPTLRKLHEVHRYDWRTNVLRVLSEALVLDIDSAHSMASSETIVADPYQNYIFGATGIFYRSGIECIKVKIAAELLWPLLAPQYSACEKMACSFMVASTLLHEFAHAVIMAQELLTYPHYAEVPGQDPEVMELLVGLRGEVLASNSKDDSGEPFFQGCSEEEVGYDFENSLWGVSALLTGMLVQPRHIHNLPFSYAFEKYPSATGVSRSTDIKPMLRFLRPVPLDYVGQFFTKKFWHEEFEAYGFDALKMMPGDAVPMATLQEPRKSDRALDIEIYGSRLTRFLRAVPDILYSSRHRVLALYLIAVKVELAYQIQHDVWWEAEIDNWEEEELFPLMESLRSLNFIVEDAQSVNIRHEAYDQGPYYADYCHEFSSPLDPSMKTFDEWQADLEEEWEETFRYGGRVMRGFLVVHGHMQIEIGGLQRLVFHCVSQMAPGTHWDLEKECTDGSMIGSAYVRLQTLHNHAASVASVADAIGRIAKLADGRDKWVAWHARFEACGAQFDKIMSIVEDRCDPDAAAAPVDVPWKARFDRLPTATWKHVSERFKKLALREYQRAQPAVRDVIDEYFAVLQRLRGKFDAPLHAQSETRIGKLQSRLEALDDIARRTGPSTPSIFHFSVPQTPSQPAPPLSPTSTRRATIARPRPRPAPASRRAAMFGVPSLTGSPPRRRISVPGRIHKRATGDARRGSLAYQKYVTNLLTSPNPRLASPAARELFLQSAGLPQPILDLLPPPPAPSSSSPPQQGPQRQQLGPARGRSATVSSGGGGGGGRRIPFSLFPNPFASRTVMTSEAVAFQERKDLARRARAATAGRAAGVYRAPSLWREKNRLSGGGSDSGEDDEDDGGGA
ncbi:hypothetical protein F4802DRAFT_538609 [Xylaria palmicola]|nr:hypothetical protein F4802DRAFT_538609 [Xylaria palmicola]